MAPPMQSDLETFAGTPEDIKEKASGPILAAIKRAEDEFNDWDSTCHLIDDIYSRHGSSYENLMAQYGDGSWRDSKLDLFWSSYEILKPAVYARPPIPAVAPMFKDGGLTKKTTAELLERASASVFARTGIDDVMQEVRDDLLFAGRGVMWLRYETEGGKQKVCVEHLDRTDFLHEPARKWKEVGWVAGGFWMTRDEIKARFKLDDDRLEEIKFLKRRDKEADDARNALTPKAKVWEVWHKANNKVYWVTDGLDTLLESGAPHLKLEDFFPCPRPAFGTLRRRSLVPVPDWERYALHFNKISTLTGRIYLLLDRVQMKGLIAAGGDVGDAVEQLMASDDDSILIPVPGAAMMATGGAANIVSWLPLAELATAIQGLIGARTQLIDDFYQLSGISDIMRGATQAEETLGAQQLKSQYGSVRVRCKIDELQRIAAGAVKIAAEIIAEKFSKETLLEMAQMELPAKRDIEKRIKEIEKAAEEELKALGKQAEEAATQVTQGEGGEGGQGEAVDPAQAQQALQQAQQEILAKYAPMLNETENLVPIEDVMTLLRDDRARSFAFEIETDSTILTDELQEKQSRNEFLGTFTTASQSLMGLAGMGEAGGKLAGELMKFVLAPYRVGRQMDSAIDGFIDAAPGMAAAQQEGDGAPEGMEGLAEAEKMKAEAAMERVKALRENDQAKNMLNQADMQRKMGEMQQKAQHDQQKAMLEAEQLRGKLSETQAKMDKTDAEIDKLRAETAKILESIGLDARKQELTEYQASAAQQDKAIDRATQEQDKAVDLQYRERGEQRADMAATAPTEEEFGQ